MHTHGYMFNKYINGTMGEINICFNGYPCKGYLTKPNINQMSTSCCGQRAPGLVVPETIKN